MNMLQNKYSYVILQIMTNAVAQRSSKMDSLTKLIMFGFE
jgi:hypothetical protein